jgi:CHAT domain-containing protein
MLLWLWECAVEPILRHLTLLSQSAKAAALPRICWLASGPLGLMPFHAAGDHSDDSTSFTMAHVVSSYVVSTQALQWCREEMAIRTQKMEQIKPKALIISMPETPDQPDLDCAEEIAMFHKAFPRVKSMVQPTASMTCEALSTAATVHFACHAESDPEDPSNSSLILLSDGGKTADRLSIYQIAGTNSPNALLAVLSACQTADQQNLDHVDETIHLAGAFQIAGFPLVVGSLWEAESDYASNLTVDFYARFAKLGGYSAGRDTGARAMHDAMVQLRSKDPEAVLSWAPFVIYGA